MLTVLGFALGHLLFGWQRYLPWFHLLIGAAYAFHLTLTWHILQTRQSDLSSQGYLFSAVIIFLGNIGFLLLGIPLLTSRVGVVKSLTWWLQDTGAILALLQALVR